MNLSLRRVRRLLPESESQLVAEVVRAPTLPEAEITRIRSLVRGWRDKYVKRAHQQAREARKKASPRSTRGSESNENTMRQADIMDWVLERLSELEVQQQEAAQERERGPQDAGSAEPAQGAPSPKEIRDAIAQPHVATFGDLWAEFPDAPVSELRKALWALVEAQEVDLTTGGGIQLSAEEEVAFVEEVQEIEGVPVKRRTRDTGVPKNHRDRLARTKIVRIRSHNRSRGVRNQAKRDRRGGGRRT